MQQTAVQARRVVKVKEMPSITDWNRFAVAHKLPLIERRKVARGIR